MPVEIRSVAMRHVPQTHRVQYWAATIKFSGKFYASPTNVPSSALTIHSGGFGRLPWDSRDIVEGDEQHRQRLLHGNAHLLRLLGANIIDERATLACGVSLGLGPHQLDVQVPRRVGHHIAADPVRGGHVESERALLLLSFQVDVTDAGGMALGSWSAASEYTDEGDAGSRCHWDEVDQPPGVFYREGRSVRHEAVQNGMRLQPGVQVNVIFVHDDKTDQ